MSDYIQTGTNRYIRKERISEFYYDDEKQRILYYEKEDQSERQIDNVSLEAWISFVSEITSG